jgi:Ca2+-binding RTX toxin-like protein
VAITLDKSALKAGETATVTFQFSEAVTGFALEDIAWDAAAGALSGLTLVNASRWTATYKPLANVTDDTNVISVKNASYSDLAGNAGASGASANFTIDTTASEGVDDPSGGVFYGTTGSDTVEGTSGDDVISGVPASGTHIGRGTIDTLWGLAGADLFILGDTRGIFYDDGNARNAGTGDYARIMDFTPEVDMIQLASGRYFLGNATVNGFSGTGIYHDTNGNGRFDNRDEMIGLLVGVSPSALASSDFTFV